MRTRALLVTCVLLSTAAPSTAFAQGLRMTVYEPLSGPDSLIAVPNPGPKPKKPMRLPSHPLANGVQAPREGNVLAAYVVSADGVVVPGSVSILESTHPKFTAAVCEVAHRQKYEPLMHEGRARRALVLMPLYFNTGSRQHRVLPDLEPWRQLSASELIDRVSRAPRCPVRK